MNPTETLPYKLADKYSVQRLALSEVRIMGFHANSDAFRTRYEATINQWTAAIILALQDEVDFSMGDGNQFTQRNFKQATHHDFYISVFMEKVAAAVDHVNSVIPRALLHKPPSG